MRLISLLLLAPLMACAQTAVNITNIEHATSVASSDYVLGITNGSGGDTRLIPVSLIQSGLSYIPQPSAANLTNWSLLPTNIFDVRYQLSDSDITNWAQLPTNVFEFRYQAGVANLTNWALLGQTNGIYAAPSTNLQASTNNGLVLFALTNRPSFNGIDVTNARGTNIDIRFGAAGTTNADGSVTVTATNNPNALTNSDTRTPNLASPLLVTPSGGAFGTFNINTNSGVGFYHYVGGPNAMVFMGGGYYFNGTNNSPNFAIVDGNGNMEWGGPGKNNNTFHAQYLVGGSQMLSNFPPVDFYQSAAACPVPEFWINYNYDADLAGPYNNLNAQYATNVIAQMVAKDWVRYGWSNICYDPGPYTNRVAGHLTANSTQFPNVTNLVSYVHSQGWRIGTYLYLSSPGCYGGLIATEDDTIFSDVTDLTAAGFDMFKMDGCNGAVYQGLPYDGRFDIFTRLVAVAWANQVQAPLYNRRPMEIDYTKFGSQNVRLVPWLETLFNTWEDGNPGGSLSVFGGMLTNFLNEQWNFPQNVRRGHFVRFPTVNYTTGSTAVNKEFITAVAMAPSSIYMGTNVSVGNSVFYTNPAVISIIKNKYVHPGYQLSTNAATGVSVFGRPLSELSGLITSSGQFNGGYDTFGGAYSNAVWMENLSGSSQTATVTWGQLGIPSNTLWSVTELWSGTVKGTYYNSFSETISSRDLGLYVFTAIPGTNSTVVNLGLDSSGNVVTNAGARTLARVTTITSSATPTVNSDNCDCVTITALAAAITSMTSNLSGTPNNFDQLEYRIKDDGTARAITWGSSFVSGPAALPTTTIISKCLHVYFEWDAVQSKWVCMSTGSDS